MKESEIRDRQVLSAHDVMQWDLRNKNKQRIHILHVMADPDYKKLYKIRREELRPSWGSIDTVIYYDIVNVICEALRESVDIREKFIELYAPIFPKSNKVISKLKTFKEADALDFIADYPDDALINYVIFAIGEKNEFKNHAYWMAPISRDSKKKDMYYEVRRFYSQPKFDNSDESILQSATYKTYLKKNREKLADYLNCQNSDLSSIINNLLSKGFEEEKNSENNGTPEMAARIERKLLMAYHQAGGYLFLAMQSKNPAWFKSYYYKPEVNHIIDDYYAAKAITAFYASKKGEFNKLTLTRGMITEHPERDLKEIFTLCNMDIIYKMFDVLMDQYYEDFSWEKLEGKSGRELIAAQTKSLENEIERCHAQIDNLQNEIKALKIRSMTDNNEAIRAYEEENKKLRDAIDELGEKNRQQKDIIESQTDLIDAIQHPIEVADEEVDVSFLQRYRYLFVGYFDTYFTELKTLFPNSVFMVNATKDIAGIQVDYIVFATRYISHSMYYKVKSAKIYTEYPSLMCNATSVNGVLSEMNRFVSRDNNEL